jgi:hypothetical protein
MVRHRPSPVRRLCQAAAGAGLLAAAIAPARADSVVLTPAQDASIFAGTPTSDQQAEGSGDYLWLSTTAEGLVRRMLLRFDLSALPPGSVVRSARLVLFESRSRADHTVSVHRLLASWSEGPANAGGSGTGVPASAGDVTWRLRNFPGLPWQQPGGDFVPTASAQALVSFPNQTYAWGDSPGLRADVQHWVDRAQDNHGWILIGDEVTPLSAKRFESRENATTVARPRLELVFDPPPLATQDGDVPLPAWALLLLATGLGWVLKQRA